MTDTSSQIAMRPPRLEEGYALPTPRRRSGFLGTARAMARPAVEAARESLEASRGGVGDYFLNMPLAALNLADAGFRGGVGAFADLVPGLRPAQRMDLAREVAAVPEAFAASVSRAPEALDEGVGALSEVARRMFREGPVPETLYSGVGPTGGPPRRTLENMRASARQRLADRDALVADLSADEAPVRMQSGELSALVSRSPDREGWRVTYFQPDGSPSGHVDAADKAAAVRRALEDQFVPVSRTAAPSPEDFGFYQDNPALTRSSGVEWLENKQRVADETYAERRGITGSTTATLGQRGDMFLPTDFLRRIPGLNRENRRPGDPRYDELLRDVQRRGFLPDQDRNKVVLGINHRGEPFLVEGNTRVAVASDVGVPNVRVEVIYKNGGEMVDGPFAPRNVARIAARGPAVPARAPLPAPRNAAEEISDDIARLLREGNVEAAEALLDRADDRRLYQLYERGEVGLDLPMDLESRLRRAREMGFVRDEFHGTTTGSNMRAPRSDYGSGSRRNIGFVTSTNPYVSSSYADPNWGSVFPLLTRGVPENALRFDAQGANWRDLPGYESANIGGQSTGPISVRLANMGEAGMRGNYDTNQVARIAFFEGLPGAEFRNIVDRGMHAPAPRGDDGQEVLREFQRRASEPSTVTMRQDTRGVRSRFARFDPRFANSRNLMAGVAGAGVMVGASDDDEEPAVRGYAQGGPVRAGIGSLNEIARGMFRA